MYEINGKYFSVTDILRRSRFLTEVNPYTALYEEYEVGDGETPQSIAYERYKSADLDWVILIFNELHNVYYEWPLNSVDLEAYVINKYSSAAYMLYYWKYDDVVVGEMKQFTTPEAWVPPEQPDIPNVYGVSFFDHEAGLNDKKRIIKLLRVELLSEFLKQFSDSLNG